MKIYCGRQNYEFELDRFVGKDVWIGIGVHSYWDDDDDPPSSMKWIRILDRIDGSRVLYKVNSISDGDNFKGELHAWVEADVKRALSDVYTAVADRLIVLKPLMLYTTDELFADVVHGYGIGEDG